MPEEEELNMKFAELVVRKKQRNLAFYVAILKGSLEFHMHKLGDCSMELCEPYFLFCFVTD